MAVSVANQWAGSFTQPVSFGTTPPALQSVVLPLTAGTSVGGGSGTPTAGNWLFTIVGMNEHATTSGFTVAVNDDVRSFWRPGNESNSTWAVSTSNALTRTAIWYTANTASIAGNIYVAPNGAFDALTVLVVEVAGLGAWDTVTGIDTNYAAAATTMNLALGAPSGTAFLLAAVAGDNTTNGQAFAPASWTTLHTVTVTDGSDHLCDSELTSAWITTSGSISVNGTASSATDLSGAVIGVLTAATSPIPASQNPNWPYMKFEGALSGGFQDPPDELTWTDLTNRAWSWDETTGIQYQLGQVQATNLDLELDNIDNMLSVDNPASLFYTQGGWSPQAAFYDNLVSAGSPAAWWKLNDASGSSSAADSSGNGHTGTATSVTFGNTSEAVTGNTSAAFASGSSSHVISSYNPSFTALTVEAWVNLNSLSQSGNSRLVANSHTDSDSKGFELFLDPSPHIYIGFTSSTANVKASASLPASGWSYVAATYDGAHLLLYVNGVQAGSVAASGTITAGTAAGIGLGYGAAYSGDYLSGLLAEAAVYGTALSAAQIAARYTAGPAGSGAPLRIRAALGTMAGTVYDRWYLLQRNGQEWPQEITEAYRRFAPVTATDIWSTLSSGDLTPYRGEVYQDAPYAWWPMDDQPLTGGVQPTTLLNAALGNTNTLTIRAASGGVSGTDAYSTTGVDLTTNGGASVATGNPLPSVATYAVGQQAGWMYGDPQSSLASYQTSNPVTSNPGSAAWEQSGLQGNSGVQGWYLTCNDAGFPGLSGGVSLGLWFNTGFFGTSGGFDITTSKYNIAGQPVAAITLAELATASAPVAVLQLNTSGALVLTTYNGATGTNHTIYSTSDMRNASWNHVMLTTNGSTWNVYVNGGLTASASGSGAGMTSAWTWLVIGADLGSSGGSSLSSATHMSNSAFSHAEVYPQVLPAWRVLGHYCAAITGFGLLPAPQTVSLSVVQESLAGMGYTPDGSEYQGSYGKTGSTTIDQFTFSATAVAEAGTATSGPAARAITANIGNSGGGSAYGSAVWVSFTALAPSVGIYTSAAANAETNAATVCGSGDSFTSGYGSGAVDGGVCSTASGTGASPPAAASALGDTPGERIERLLGYANATYPGRCVDPGTLAIQAATDIGGQQAGQNITNIAESDGGLLFVDTQGNLTYWAKSHLASQYSSPTWTLSPAAGAGQVPYYREGFRWDGDPQQVWNFITITPFAPDGSSLASITPTSAAAVNASQAQYGAQPLQITSYLQSATEMQSQANWLFGNFGGLQIRVDNAKIDAAPYPAAWAMVLGASVGDVISVQNWQIGGGGATGTFRITRLRRHLQFGGQDGDVEGTLEIQASFEPPSYWS